MLEANGIGAKLVVTENLEEAIEGADYVLGQDHYSLGENRQSGNRF